MASIANDIRISQPYLSKRSQFQTRIRGEKVTTARANGSPFVDKIVSRVNGGNGQKKSKETRIEDELEVLWEDGYGKTTVKDYLEMAKGLIHNDGGPPRWFCPVDCGRPVKDSPVLLFLPGLDGLGLGLCLHHKTLGRVFEVRCFHIPVYDQTPFQELVKMVEKTVRLEQDVRPDKPIYLVGDSFGGCLALAVAARNPYIDIILVLINPATSIKESQLEPLFPILEVLPDELHATVPYFLSFVMGDPVRMAMVNIDKRLPPTQKLQRLSENLIPLLPSLVGLSDIIPKETLLWKLKLLRIGASYANSRLHAVKAEVLVLASKDNMLPSMDEAQRLLKSIKNCTVRNFKDNGHTLLLEDGVHLLAIIKGVVKYRRFRHHNFVSDYIPPSHTEFEIHKQSLGLRDIVSPVTLSTLEDGKIVKGISGVPDEGPVLFVGYHMLWGMEVPLLVEEFLNERKVMLRAMAHPALYSLDTQDDETGEMSYKDKMRQFGSVPVTPSYLYRLLASNAFILLYPGGVREALHRKGEEYQLFWPEQPEFVRMAARFEATIVPFGVVGEDDIAKLVFDYNDQINTPIFRDWVREQNENAMRIRGDARGEVANQDIHNPIVAPKIPGRFYYLFGKPIKTKGRKELLRNKQSANDLYSQIKADIGKTIRYLKVKREKDPYRGIVERTIYKASQSLYNTDVPTFEI